MTDATTRAADLLRAGGFLNPGETVNPQPLKK